MPDFRAYFIAAVIKTLWDRLRSGEPKYRPIQIFPIDILQRCKSNLIEEK